MNFDMDRYTDICTDHCGENPPLQWIEIARLFEPRIERGWRFVQNDDGVPYWAFGLGRTALLVVDVELETRRFHLFEYASDSGTYCDDIGELTILLDELELTNRGLTPLQVEMIENEVGSIAMLTQLQHELARQDAALNLK